MLASDRRGLRGVAARQRLFTRRRPIGVVGLITPWNFPAAIPAWKLGAALAYGNAVVLKLGYESPRTGLHLAECSRSRASRREYSTYSPAPALRPAPIVAQPAVRALSFTGSVPVGHGVREEATAPAAVSSSSWVAITR